MLLTKAEVRERVRERDQQRSKLYAAEVVLKPFQSPLLTVTDVETFVKKVWTSERVKKSFPKAVVRGSEPKVKDGRGRRNACGGVHSISIPLWARNSWVVVHELSHTITQREFGFRVAAHGWQFCHVFLKLTLYAMGREAHDALYKQFRKDRVKFKAPRARRQLDPVKRAMLIERLALARAAKQQKMAAKPEE